MIEEAIDTQPKQGCIATDLTNDHIERLDWVSQFEITGGLIES